MGKDDHIHMWELRGSNEARLFSAVNDLSELRQYLIVLRDKMRADGAVLRFIDLKNGRDVLRMECGAGLLGDAFFEAGEPYRAINPHLQVAASKKLPYPHIYNCTDHYDANDRKGHPYFRDFLAARGIKWVAAYMVDVDDTIGAAVAVVREEGRPPFNDSDKDTLTPTALILEDAARIIWKAQRDRLIQSAQLIAKDHQAEYAYCLSDNYELLWNDRGLKTLTNTFGVKVKRSANGRMLIRQKSIPGRLQKNASFRFSDTEEFEELITGLDGRRYKFVMKRLLADAVKYAAITPSGFVMLFRNKSSAERLIADAVYHNISLTKAEQGIIALLRQGRSTKQIAEDRKVKVSTTQSQLKTLYKKFGVKNRSQLLLEIVRAEKK